MSQELFLKKKEQNLQHQLLLQQQHHHSFPSPITPSPFDKKVFSSATSSSTSRQEASSNGSSSHLALDVPSSSLFSPSASSTTSTPNSSLSSNSQRHSYIQNPFSDVYGSGGGFLSSSYTALGTPHHDLSRSSCSALPSPTIYPPTPPPSTHWVHPAWFGSLESAGYMKTPKSSNSYENWTYIFYINIDLITVIVINYKFWC